MLVSQVLQHNVRSKSLDKSYIKRRPLQPQPAVYPPPVLYDFFKQHPSTERTDKHNLFLCVQVCCRPAGSGPSLNLSHSAANKGVECVCGFSLFGSFKASDINLITGRCTQMSVMWWGDVTDRVSRTWRLLSFYNVLSVFIVGQQAHRWFVPNRKTAEIISQKGFDVGLYIQASQCNQSFLMII